jgi:hypothetical protein
LAAFILVLSATAFAEQTNVLFVANGYYEQETDVYNHLQDLGMFDVEIKKDYQIYGSTDLTAYDLIIITGFAPNIGYSATNNIKNSGIPLMIIEYWDFWYSYRMGLLNWDSGDYYGTDTVELLDDQHPITNGLDQEVEVYDESWAVLYGASINSLSSGTEPLIYSWQSANEAAVIVDDDRKIVATGIYDTTHYTDDAWEIFDNIIYFLLPYEFPPPPPALATLFVANGWDSDEDAIEEHLANDTRAFEIVRMTDSEIDGSTNLMNFDLVVISANAQGISSAGLANIVDSEVPTLIIEDDDFGYAYDLGLTTTSSGVYATTDTVKADEDYLGALLSRLGSTVTVQQPSGDVAGISASNLVQGVTPLYHSNFDYDEVGIFIDHSKNIAVTGLSDTSRYTSDAWVMLDALIREIADMEVRRTSLQETAQTYFDSEIPNFLELAEIERIRDPETWTLEAVLDSLWLKTVEWRLFDLWDMIRRSAFDVFERYPYDYPWVETTYVHGERERGPCSGCLPDSWGHEYWFLGETQASHNAKAADIDAGDADGPQDGTPPYDNPEDDDTLPPVYGGLHDGSDLGVSVELHGKTFYYMGDTWNADKYNTLEPILEAWSNNTSWSHHDCANGVVCNDMIATSTDSNADDGIDIVPRLELDSNEYRFEGLRIEQVHYEGANGTLAPDLTGFWFANLIFNAPTGAVVFNQVFDTKMKIGQLGQWKNAQWIIPTVMVWYGTASAPKAPLSSEVRRRPTSWAGCSIDGTTFFSCYEDDNGDAVPFSIDEFIWVQNPSFNITNNQNNPARFIQVAPVPLSEEDFDWICQEDPNTPTSPMCDIDPAFREGMLLYGNGRPYRKSGLFLAYLPYNFIGTLKGDGRPLMYYWDGSGWSFEESEAVSLFHYPQSPPYDECINIANPLLTECANGVPSLSPDEKNYLFGEMSARLVRGDYDRKVFLLSNPPGPDTGDNAWRFSIKTPWIADDTQPHNLQTTGYGPYIIGRYSDNEWDNEAGRVGPKFYHLISTWWGHNGPTPYGVFSGEEEVPWSP